MQANMETTYTPRIPLKSGLEQFARFCGVNGDADGMYPVEDLNKVIKVLTDVTSRFRVEKKWASELPKVVKPTPPIIAAMPAMPNASAVQARPKPVVLVRKNEPVKNTAAAPQQAVDTAQGTASNPTKGTAAAHDTASNSALTEAAIKATASKATQTDTEIQDTASKAVQAEATIEYTASKATQTDAEIQDTASKATQANIPVNESFGSFDQDDTPMQDILDSPPQEAALGNSAQDDTPMQDPLGTPTQAEGAMSHTLGNPTQDEAPTEHTLPSPTQEAASVQDIFLNATPQETLQPNTMAEKTGNEQPTATKQPQRGTRQAAHKKQASKGKQTAVQVTIVMRSRSTPPIPPEIAEQLAAHLNAINHQQFADKAAALKTEADHWWEQRRLEHEARIGKAYTDEEWDEYWRYFGFRTAKDFLATYKWSCADENDPDAIFLTIRKKMAAFRLIKRHEDAAKGGYELPRPNPYRFEFGSERPKWKIVFETQRAKVPKLGAGDDATQDTDMVMSDRQVREEARRALFARPDSRATALQDHSLKRRYEDSDLEEGFDAAAALTAPPKRRRRAEPKAGKQKSKSQG